MRRISKLDKRVQSELAATDRPIAGGRLHRLALAEARPDRTAGIIWFVTDLRSSKEHEIESEHDVRLVFLDAKANAYLSITARADVRRDPAKAAEIWKATDDMWWNGRRSERVRAARHSVHRRVMGWACEQGRSRVRVRQGATHRRRAEPRRESQGHGFNVTRAERQGRACHALGHR
jgi:general stress protein 26